MRSSAYPFLPIVLVPLILIGTPQLSQGWQTLINGSANGFDNARTTTLDSHGDVISAGVLRNATTNDDFAVVKLSGATGAELWRQEINLGACIPCARRDQARSVGVDRFNDVVAAGSLELGGLDRFAVIKFSGATGAELWRRTFHGGFNSRSNFALSVTTDPDGDVLAAGSLQDFETDQDFFVIKLSGATGDELWRYTISSNGDDRADSVVVNAESDVIAVGSVNRESMLVKLAGADGTEKWRQQIDIFANSLKLDHIGDILVAGLTINTATLLDFAVMKFSGTTGDELWRHEIMTTATELAHSVAVDSNGNVVAAGSVAGASFDFAVVKLSGSAGEVLWERVIDGSDGSEDEARVVEVDAGGDVIVGGDLISNFTLVKFAGADGAEIWRTEIAGGSRVNALVVDSKGEVVAAGGLFRDFAVVKLTGDNGLDFPCGDGVIQTGEDCDDGNGVNGDGCSRECILEQCGDVNDDHLVDEDDVFVFRLFLADPEGSPLSQGGQGKCKVVLDPANEPRLCDVLDVVVLRRAVERPSLLPGIADVCEARLGCGAKGGNSDSDTLCDEEDPCRFFTNTLPLVISGSSGIPDECLCGDFDGDGFHSVTDASAINECASFARLDCVSERDEVDGRIDGFYSATDASLVDRVATDIDPAYTLTCGRRPEGTCSEAAGVPCDFRRPLRYGERSSKTRRPSPDCSA